MTPHNIWCVGRNYSEHAKELGNAVPTTPLIFLKAGSSAVPDGQELFWPEGLGPIHFEAELAIEFDDRLQFARAGVALDFTARETQDKLKAKSEPWTLAKSFRHACGLGPLEIVSDWSALTRTGEIKFWVNDQLKQHGHFSDMIFSIETLRQYVCERFPVVPGDILLTGTPQGVGPLKKGDLLRAEVPGLTRAEWRVGL